MSDCNFLFMPWLYWIMKNVWARRLNCSFSCLTSTGSRQNKADVWPVLWWLRWHNLNWINDKRRQPYDWQVTKHIRGGWSFKKWWLQCQTCRTSVRSPLSIGPTGSFSIFQSQQTCQSSKSDGWLQRSVAQSVTLQRQLAWNVHTSVWKHFLTLAACKQLVKGAHFHLCFFFFFKQRCHKPNNSWLTCEKCGMSHLSVGCHTSGSLMTTQHRGDRIPPSCSLVKLLLLFCTIQG